MVSAISSHLDKFWRLMLLGDIAQLVLYSSLCLYSPVSISPFQTAWLQEVTHFQTYCLSNHPKPPFYNFKACFHIRVCRFLKMQLWSSLGHHLIAKELNNCGLSHYPFREHENVKELYITQKKLHLMWLKDVEVKRLESRLSGLCPRGMS